MPTTPAAQDDNDQQAPGAAADGPFAIVGRLLGAEPNDVDGAVVVDGGVIRSVDIPANPARLPPRQVRAAFVAPGFIDLQVNGGFGFEVGDDWAALGALAARLPATGVTSFLPTLVSRPAAAYARAFAAYDAFTAAGASTMSSGAHSLGLHLEGPLLAPARHGAHDRRAIEAADAALLDRLADPRRVRIVTLAPECPGAVELTARLRARGVVVALGHTDATFDEFTAAVDAGATLATHVFNAMSPLHHRAPGASGAALTDDRIVAVMIADGVHTHPAVFKLAARAKGIDRLALVTDATPGAGLGPGRSTLGGQTVILDHQAARLQDGTLAGSTLTLDRAVRNGVAFAGLTPAAAVHLVTAVPARVLGLDDRGTLAVGRRADVVLLDAALNVQATYVGGRLAHGTPGAR